MQEKINMEKKEVKQKVVKKRMSEEIAGRTKCQTIENDKQGRKEYIKASTSGTIKDIIKIRLHIWDLKADYGRFGQQMPNVSVRRGATKHFLECMVEMYRQNKKNGSIHNIGEDQIILEEQKKREDSRRQKAIYFREEENERKKSRRTKRQ